MGVLLKLWMRGIAFALIPFMFAGCLRVKLPPAVIVSGQGRAGLTWEEAAQEAFRNHPDLIREREELKSKKHNWIEALGEYLPDVDGSLNRKRARTTTSKMSDAWALDLDVAQPIFTGFETTGDALKARREWEAARWAYLEESAAVRRDLRVSFVELLRLYELLEVNQGIAARREENAGLIQLRYEAGREHEGSVKRAQAIAGQSAFEVRQTERKIESQSLALGRALGGDFVVPIPLSGELEALIPNDPEPPEDYAVLALGTPSVERLTKSAEALKAAILSAQAEFWPTAQGAVNYGYSGSKLSNMKDDASIGVTVSLPIFHGGGNVQGALEARADYRAALEEARSERDQKIADLSLSWAAFRDAWELVSVRRAFVEAARLRAEIVRTQYTTGLSDFQDFDIAEQELADSEKTYVQALADVLSKEADWMEAKGETLEEVLNEE